MKPPHFFEKIHYFYLISEEVVDYYNRTITTGALLDLRNITKMAELIIRSAMARKESREPHFSTDCSEDRTPSQVDTVFRNEATDFYWKAIH